MFLMYLLCVISIIVLICTILKCIFSFSIKKFIIPCFIILLIAVVIKSSVPLKINTTNYYEINNISYKDNQTILEYTTENNKQKTYKINTTIQKDDSIYLVLKESVGYRWFIKDISYDLLIQSHNETKSLIHVNNTY